MSRLPSTLKEITRAGYKLLQRRPCLRCGETIEFWRTSRGYEIYFNPMIDGDDRAVLHGDTCKRNTNAQANAVPHFAASQNAAVVIVLDRNLNAKWTVANDCKDEPMDIHNAITVAANAVARYIESRINQEAQ